MTPVACIFLVLMTCGLSEGPATSPATQEAVEKRSDDEIREVGSRMQKAMLVAVEELDRTGEWPANLLESIPKKLREKLPPTLVYARPTRPIQNWGGNVPVLFENKMWTGQPLWVFFADGHGELVSDEKEFQRLQFLAGINGGP
ncbi:MAG: hypothetical protein AAGD32_10630 [Planctomycetota bacterium]